MKTFVFYSSLRKDVVVINTTTRDLAIEKLNTDVKNRFNTVADDYIFVSTLNGEGVTGVDVSHSI